MDDEKSMTEKLTDALGKATDSVKSTIGNMVDTASSAAQRAMESNAERMSGQSAAELDSEQAAGSVNGQVYLPAATDAAAMPVPLIAARVRRKPRKARATSRAPPSSSMASDFRSIRIFSPSSSTCRFSSRVPNMASMLGPMAILFFI